MTHTYFKNQKITLELSREQSEEFLSLFRNLSELFTSEELLQRIGNTYFDVKQLSEFLRIPENTVYQMTSKREIPYIKMGRKLYFKRSEIEKWLDAGKIDNIKPSLTE
ncbi:MAG: helix-turn-helix domain-containing protein [bacterium]